MASSAPPNPTLVEVSTQVLSYLGLSTAFGIGMTVAVLTIPQCRGGEVARRVRGFALPAVVLVLVTAVAHFAAADSGRGGFEGQRSALLAGSYALVVLILIAMRLRGTRTVGVMLAVCAAVTAVIPELPTSVLTAAHAATNALTLAHVLGALAWVGGLVVLAAAGLLDRRRPDASGGRTLEWLHTWERFTVVALCSVGALIVSGAWLSWSHVGTPMQLFSTPYGRVLAFKLALVGLLLIAGAYNVRVLIPKIHAARRRGDDRTAFAVAMKHFPVVVGSESLLVTAVLTLVPFLRGSARSEAGGPPAGPFDLQTFGMGLVLIALVAASLWLGTRSSAAVHDEAD